MTYEDDKSYYHYQEWADGRYRFTEYADMHDAQAAILNSDKDFTLTENRIIVGPKGASTVGSNSVPVQTHTSEHLMKYGVVSTIILALIIAYFVTVN